MVELLNCRPHDKRTAPPDLGGYATDLVASSRSNGLSQSKKAKKALIRRPV
jgi:hypothetical protein